MKLRKKKQKIFYVKDAAARAFGCEALPLTAQDAKERSAILYPIRITSINKKGAKVRTKAYSYSRLMTGGHNHVVLSVIICYLLWFFIPKRICILHTHPLCNGHKPKAFSKADELVARLPFVKYMYLASPHGNLYKYDGKPTKRNVKGELILPIIYDNMPKVKKRCDCVGKHLPKRLTKKQIKQITANNVFFKDCLIQNV